MLLSARASVDTRLYYALGFYSNTICISVYTTLSSTQGVGIYYEKKAVGLDSSWGDFAEIELEEY